VGGPSGLFISKLQEERQTAPSPLTEEAIRHTTGSFEDLSLNRVAITNGALNFTLPVLVAMEGNLWFVCYWALKKGSTVGVTRGGLIRTRSKMPSLLHSCGMCVVPMGTLATKRG